MGDTEYFVGPHLKASLTQLSSSFPSNLSCVLGALLLVSCWSALADVSPAPRHQVSSASAAGPDWAPIAGTGQCPLDADDFKLLVEIEQGQWVPDNEKDLGKGQIPLSVEDMNLWYRKISELESDSLPLVVGDILNRPVFVAVFDGTWNDREDRNSPVTVPGLLSRELEALQAGSRDLEVKYYNGVGTRVSWMRSMYEGATGEGTIDRAINAFSDFQAYIKQTGVVPAVYTIGFSRGAASARHFLNLVDPVLRGQSNRGLLERPYSFALLYDTVATGQTSLLKLGIPPTTLSAVHFTASHERRLMFPVVDILPDGVKARVGQRIVEVPLPAAHSNLGGGYGGGLETLSLMLSEKILVQQGFLVPEPALESQAILNMGRNNSDWPFTAIAYWIKTKLKGGGRGHIVPDMVVSQRSEADPIKLLNLTGYEAASSTAALNRALNSKGSQGQTYSAYVSIELNNSERGIRLTTNCPQHVKYERGSSKIIFDGEFYGTISPSANKLLEAGNGLYFSISKQNRSLFRPNK